VKEPTFPRTYNAASDFVDRNVAEGRADKPAFIDPDRELTYGALQDQSRRFANALGHLGVEREQRLALIMLDTVAMPVAFWGAIRAGVVPVPLNTLLTTEQYQHILDDARATALVISGALLPKVEPLIADHPWLHTIIVADGEAPGYALRFEQVLEESAPKASAAETCCDEIGFWLYSSGSTGRPKGVKHLHSSLMRTAHLYGRQVLGITENDVVFSAAKLFFAYGLGNAMSFPMSVGATTILLPGRPTPDAVLEVMAGRNPSLFFGVPTLYSALLAHPGLGKGAGSKNLRLCVSAGEALPKEIGERWAGTVGVDILDGIGSTELLHIFISNRPGEVVYGSSGLPVPGYAARIVDAEGTTVAVGDIGELLVSGPSAAEGYWNQRDKTRATFAGEWTHTGDNYRRGADGLYYYCGRSDDMFKVSGNWVSPFEVESALMSHDVVLEAAVVGAEDAEGLVKPKAFIVLKGGFKPYDGLIDELKTHVKTVAGPWKYPRWIEILDDLPKTATGKIQRFKLRRDAPRDAAE
jgi:4-hydroxybenzoate-CoA ligase